MSRCSHQLEGISWPPHETQQSAAAHFILAAAFFSQTKHKKKAHSAPPFRRQTRSRTRLKQILWEANECFTLLSATLLISWNKALRERKTAAWRSAGGQFSKEYSELWATVAFGGLIGPLLRSKLVVFFDNEWGEKLSRRKFSSTNKYPDDRQHVLPVIFFFQKAIFYMLRSSTWPWCLSSAFIIACSFMACGDFFFFVLKATPPPHSAVLQKLRPYLIDVFSSSALGR